MIRSWTKCNDTEVSWRRKGGYFAKGSSMNANDHKVNCGRLYFSKMSATIFLASRTGPHQSLS
jgi:hypothetical protein